MTNLKAIYDWLTFFLFVDIVLGLWYVETALIYALIYIVIYSICVIILGFIKADKEINKFFILFGSLILPGIMPFIYYSTYLRGILKRETLVNDIKQRTLEEIQRASESSNSPIVKS